MTVKPANERTSPYNFETVLELERDSIRRRRRAAKIDLSVGSDESPNPPADLFGVSLSGGGIRSASYCLGALQALHAWGLINRIDYLSTVSGGGYIGTSMIAGMYANQHNNRTAGVPVECEFPFSRSSTRNIRDCEAVSHLRDYSRFLAPGGLMDIIASFAIIMRGWAVNILLLLAFLLPLASVFILTNPTTKHLEHSILLDLTNLVLNTEWKATSVWWPKVEPAIASPFFFTAAAASCLILWLAGWAIYRSYDESAGRVRRRDEPSLEYDGLGARVGRLLLIALAFAGVMELQPIIIAAITKRMVAQPPSVGSVTGLATIGASIVAFSAVFQGKLTVWIQRALSVPSIAARLRSLLAKSILYVAALILPFLIYGVFLTIVISGIRSGNSYPFASTLLISRNWVFSLSLCFFSLLFVAGSQIVSWSIKRNPWDTQTVIRKVHFNLRVLALIAIWLIVLPIAGISTRIGPEEKIEDWIVLGNYLALTLAVIVVSATFTENANGLHRLYRDRLRLAYRLSDGAGKPLPLHALPDLAPYLLVNGTLNARLPKKEESKRKAGAAPPIPPNRPPDPAKRGRNAEFFLFSKHAIGSETTLYADPKWISSAEPELDLAAAAAISGAAVSSSMGRIGIGLLGPTLALLNLRLGFWLPNPSRPEAKNRHWEDLFRLYLFAEAFGRLRSDSSRIYVTDGGHIDNIGLYQLLKRRCKFIIVVDSEADPAMNFSAFADVQRFARIDEGVLISLDWRTFRNTTLERLADRSVPGAASRENPPRISIGCITYEGGEEGILLYVKAAVMGSEPDYVLDYERRYPDFPHEATSDQFFSEEQMEAYRALGFHAVNEAFARAPMGSRTSVKPNKTLKYSEMDHDALLLEVMERLKARRLSPT